MQVTLEALSTQVTRLEGVCDIYILEDNPYLDEHPRRLSNDMRYSCL